MIVLELVHSPDASVAICFQSTLRRALNIHARIVNVKHSCSFQGDLKSWVNGGCQEEKVLISTLGVQAANASIHTKSMEPTSLTNVKHAHVKGSFLTFVV